MRKHTSKITTSLAALAAMIAVAACGNSAPTAHQTTHNQQTFLQTNNVDLLFGDCSGSFIGVIKTFVPTMVTIAENSADNRRTLWAGCFDAAPLRDLQWHPQINFGDLPSPIANNSTLAHEFNQARALGLQPQLLSMITHTPIRVPGSGQLEALELAAQTAHVGRVFMITDAQINELDGVNMLTATPTQINQCIRRWVPRLRALKDVQLWIIGAGFGAPTSPSVRRSETLFRRLAKTIGTPLSWSQTLPAGFPTAPQN